MATPAVGTIDVRATASEAEVGEFAVDPGIHGQHRIHKDRRRRAVFQVTARMFMRGVKLDRGYVHRLRLVSSWPHAKWFACPLYEFLDMRGTKVSQMSVWIHYALPW